MTAGTQHDVLIVGAGMVGATAASLLSRCGLKVALIDTQRPPEFDPQKPVGLRVSALSCGSIAILGQAGAWPAVAARGRHAAYRRMHVEDRDADAALEFEAPAFGLEQLGVIAENDSVQDALWQALEQAPGLSIHCPARVQALAQTRAGVSVELADGRRFSGRLLLGCDGAQSQVRRLAGIAEEVWEYAQAGLVCTVAKSLRNPGVAWQRFLDQGPLAFLPLADGQSSIVWTLSRDSAERLRLASAESFRSELAEASRGWLGEVEHTGERACFPLAMRLSRRLVAGRVVLLGDAAHVVHPLAGQGVNMGLADAAALVEVLGTGVAADGAPDWDARLAHFARWRRSESAVMALGIHALGALFRPAALHSVRRLGLGLMRESWAARNLFVQRAAGLGADAPELARGGSLAALTQRRPNARAAG